MHHQQDLHLVAPPPMYPMYVTETKEPKRSHETPEERSCCCFRRRKKKRKSIIRILSTKTRLINFFSVYGIPYFLVIPGLFSSILCPLMSLIFINDCPALPVLVPVLLSKGVLGILEWVLMFFMTVEAFQLDKSVLWISRISGKVNWRIVGGMCLSFFIVWFTVLMISVNPRFVNHDAVSYDPASPRYCHETLYTFALICTNTVITVCVSTISLFFVGSCVALVLLGIVSRIE